MLSVFTIASVLALASSTFAARAGITNRCDQDVYLTITHPDQISTQQTLAAKGGQFSEEIKGQGTSYGLSKGKDYYSPTTPKLIFGASDSAGTLYYSLSTANGNPFDGQALKLFGDDSACPVATSPDGAVKACSNSGNFNLWLC